MANAPRIELNTAASDAIDGRELRAVAFQAARMSYVTATVEKLELDPRVSRMLVVGGGRGLLPAGLARLGFEVVAIDGSATATQLARERVDSEGLDVVLETAPAEQLGIPAAGFDVAFYADTFEVTLDLDAVIAEAARVLRPGGTLLYDTVNCTLLSRLVYLGAFQALPMTRIMPRGRYSAGRLRPPAELATTMSRHGLRNEDVCGFKPENPRDLVKAIQAVRRGEIAADEVASAVRFLLEPDKPPLVTYLGHARKPEHA